MKKKQHPNTYPTAGERMLVRKTARKTTFFGAQKFSNYDRPIEGTFATKGNIGRGLTYVS